MGGIAMTEEKYDRIKQLCEHSDLTNTAIADIVGVSPTTVSYVRRADNWGDYQYMVSAKARPRGPKNKQARPPKPEQQQLLEENAGRLATLFQEMVTTMVGLSGECDELTRAVRDLIVVMREHYDKPEVEPSAIPGAGDPIDDNVDEDIMDDPPRRRRGMFMRKGV